eukprot:TRINITY_DN9613_c0_g1_i1.p1 TRINITY_DN9613_c0_g1~~TRINITY_DN9613_c0_g1_i1.p1  ORF type:complete len:100 (-),score=3.22 TRINITY_DN9613_c0_g1_i1:145-444(-)
MRSQFRVCPLSQGLDRAPFTSVKQASNAEDIGAIEGRDMRKLWTACLSSKSRTDGSTLAPLVFQLSTYLILVTFGGSILSVPLTFPLQGHSLLPFSFII